MSGENEGNLRKPGEGLKRRSPSVNKVLLTFSRGCARGSKEFSRLPDSATLAPLRLVELAPCQGRLGADVSSLQSAPGGAYREECDFSIAFLFARRASTQYDGRSNGVGSIRLRRKLLWLGGNSLVGTSGASPVYLVIWSVWSIWLG
jgi:hypothetical protein